MSKLWRFLPYGAMASTRPSVLCDQVPSVRITWSWDLMRTFNMTQWTNCQSRNALVQCTCRPNVSYSLIFRASYLVDAKWNPPEIKENISVISLLLLHSFNLILLKSVRAFTSEPLCWIQWDQWIVLLGVLFQLRLSNPKEKKKIIMLDSLWMLIKYPWETLCIFASCY